MTKLEVLLAEKERYRKGYQMFIDNPPRGSVEEEWAEKMIQDIIKIERQIKELQNA